MVDIQSVNGTVFATARLNLRKGQPSRSAPVLRTVEPGTSLTVLGKASGQVVSGNGLWFAGLEDSYFWSGGCSNLAPDPVAGSAPAAALPGGGPKVSRRANGTILPLSDEAMRQVFGIFPYQEAAKGAIRIDPAWIKSNIVEMKTPLLSDEGFPVIRVHRAAERHFAAVFDEIASAGLTGIILTCAGTFVPRHKGWKPNRGLSSHSWGVAIDFNVHWNGYGKIPAAAGTVGSLHEIVPIFERHGFAWGGYFSSPYEDGMHFELARSDI